MSTYIKRIERSQINDLMLYLKLLEKQEQANPRLGLLLGQALGLSPLEYPGSWSCRTVTDFKAQSEAQFPGSDM
jgi:hypothetical protein